MTDQNASQASTLPMVVTGAAGFIGQRVTTQLAATGAQILAIDRAEKPAGFPSDVEYIRVDLSDGFPAIPEHFILAHLAWDMARGDPEAQAHSVDIFALLLKHAGLSGVVGMGSAEEYGELEGCLREEMAPGYRLSAYGWSKVMTCRDVRLWCRDTGRAAVWLRPFIAYGPKQRGDMAIPYALRCARERLAAEFSEGLQERDFVHVDDVAAGVVRAALHLPQAEGFTMCNLGCGTPVRLRDVLERIAQQTGSQERFHFGVRPMRLGEPKQQFADWNSAKQVLGWSPHYTWQEGIDALCRTAGEGTPA